MKRVFSLAAFLFFSLAGPSFAAHFGPAQPVGKGGQLSIGPGMFFYTGEWNNGAEVEQTQVYAQLGYSFTNNFEIYAQAGTADLAIGDFEDGYRPFGGGGLRWLLTDRQPIGIGLFVQGSYFGEYDDTVNSTQLKLIRSYEVNGGLALQTVIEGAYLYGGPVVFYREGHLEVRQGPNTTAEFDSEEDSNIGAFLGIRWPLRKHGINVELESQYKTELSFGGAIHFSF